MRAGPQPEFLLVVASGLEQHGSLRAEGGEDGTGCSA